MVHSEWVEGGILAVPGFRAQGERVDIKPRCRDLAIIASEVPCAGAAVTTHNAFRAAPVELARRRVLPPGIWKSTRTMSDT